MNMRERMGSFEQRLDALTGEVGILRGEVGELRTEVGQLRTEVGELRSEVGGLRSEVGELRSEVGELRTEVGQLRSEVHGLRIIVEHHDDQLKMLAEVQAHHGRQLEEHGVLLHRILAQMEPLQDLHVFVRQMSQDHERRIGALEKKTGIH